MLKWCKEFKEGIHDEQRSGRPSVSDETIAKVDAAMRADRRLTIRELNLCLLAQQLMLNATAKLLKDLGGPYKSRGGTD